MCQKKEQSQESNKDNRVRPEKNDPQQPILLKFWEIENMFKCPVVGMCLTYSEQKQVLKKAGISIKRKNQFEIHERLVASSDDENRLSRKVDNLLRRKFGRRHLKPMNFRQHCGPPLPVPVCRWNAVEKSLGQCI